MGCFFIYNFTPQKYNNFPETTKCFNTFNFCVKYIKNSCGIENNILPLHYQTYKSKCYGRNLEGH